MGAAFRSRGVRPWTRLEIEIERRGAAKSRDDVVPDLREAAADELFEMKSLKYADATPLEPKAVYNQACKIAESAAFWQSPTRPPITLLSSSSSDLYAPLLWIRRKLWRSRMV